MKALLVGLLLASIAGVEFAHELWRGDVNAALVCTAPQAKDAMSANQDTMNELFVQHLRNH